MKVIRGARLIDPACSRDEVVDVWLEGARVHEIVPPGARPLAQGHQVIEAAERWLLPGFTDLHVHFREPGQEHKEDIRSGLKAAAAGGFTTVCSMANTRPVNDNATVTQSMLGKALELGPATRLLPFGSVSKGLAGEELAPMGALRRAGAVGVSDDGLCVRSSALMRSALQYATGFDLIVSQHAEDHCLTKGGQMHEGVRSMTLGLRGWPREAEDVIVARDLILNERVGARYHVAHVSSLGSVRLLREAKARGQRVSAEVTPHHLLLTDECLLGYDTHCKVNPPLREEADRLALVAALKDGTVDCIATDHAPHATEDKACEFELAAVGINGLETAFPVLLQLVERGELSLMRLVDALSSAPARLLGEPAGPLRSESAADLVLFDPRVEWRPQADALVSKSHNSPWLGRPLKGRIEWTMVAGQMVYQRSHS